MDLTLEGILMILLIAIIVIFIVLSLINFFTPNSSFYYYTDLVSMANHGCLSAQQSSNIQLNNPNAVVFQVYDNSTCNATLSANRNIFEANASYDGAVSYGKYLLCYAPSPNLPGYAQSQQYYLKQPGASISAIGPDFFYPLASSNTATKAVDNISYLNAGPLSEYSPMNEIGMPAIQTNLSYDAQYGTTLVLAYSNATYPGIPSAMRLMNGSLYTFVLTASANVSANFNLFIDGISVSAGKYSRGPTPLVAHLSSATKAAVSSVSLEVQPIKVGTGGLNPPFTYQFNLTAVPISNPAQPYYDAVLASQCTNIVNKVKQGVFTNGSIVCAPISCGGNSFMLTDTQNRPLLSLYGGTYNYFAIQSGDGVLQIINPNSENVVDYPIVGNEMQTVFTEAGLPIGYQWSVDYDGVVETEMAPNSISFLTPPGTFSYTVQAESYSASPSSGSSVAGSSQIISFT